MTNEYLRPTIPRQEFLARWSRVQHLMDSLALDLLLAYADDRAVFGHAHARWLGNFPVHFEPACIVMPRDRFAERNNEPILLTGPESVEYALRVGTVRDVRAASMFVHPDEDYPFAKIHALTDIFTEAMRGVPPKRVGVAGKGRICADVWDALQRALPNVAWVDVENQMCDLRAVKSPAEIEVIRYAYQIAQAGFDAAVKAIGVGVTEREVAAEAEYAMRRMGAEGMGIDTIVASGPNARAILARATT